MPRAQRAEQQRQHKNQYKADPAQNQRKRQTRADDLHNVHLILVGDSEIAVQGVLEPADILRHQRRIQTEACLGRRAFGGSQLLGAVAIVGEALRCNTARDCGAS